MGGQPEYQDDRALVQACLEGRREAQKALYERFAPRMLGLCVRYVGNRVDAEEVMQEGFISVFLHLHQFRFAGSLEGWIRRIMVRAAVNYTRRRKWISLDDSKEDTEQNSVAVQTTAEERELIQLILQMPKGYRTIFNLYVVEGYAHREIAELLGIDEGTSRSQFARARAWLQARLSADQQRISTHMNKKLHDL
ncbi:RNA polymerase sigma-70 factor (ECF subfamily) [Thermoflavifilum aggregans]|uniref:RNA polymerase sigma-70 factor (ECF subfamily) n=1 Tax=Thermoflavifilum aggregans TaxID=454188 RepID=A0A2M9CRM5_9BACT|nr:sigma-70 family RNA polymerase sigma factor [Thermoflavifilum aggregans]PJJ74491.1 RNA polymerase sigma-70 factor (ECF subfamily) [Thermoflavifilum aggregans]